MKELKKENIKKLKWWILQIISLVIFGFFVSIIVNSNTSLIIKVFALGIIHIVTAINIMVIDMFTD